MIFQISAHLCIKEKEKRKRKGPSTSHEFTEPRSAISCVYTLSIWTQLKVSIIIFHPSLLTLDWNRAEDKEDAGRPSFGQRRESRQPR
jgi:hypothetical protein